MPTSELQFEFIDFEEAARPTARRLYTLHVGDWWVCHPEKGIAFSVMGPKLRRSYHPVCNPVEDIAKAVLATITKHEGYDELEVRKIERAFIPVDFEGNYLVPQRKTNPS